MLTLATFLAGACCVGLEQDLFLDKSTLIKAIPYVSMGLAFNFSTVTFSLELCELLKKCFDFLVGYQYTPIIVTNLMYTLTLFTCIFMGSIQGIVFANDDIETVSTKVLMLSELAHLESVILLPLSLYIGLVWGYVLIIIRSDEIDLQEKDDAKLEFI